MCLMGRLKKFLGATKRTTVSVGEGFHVALGVLVAGVPVEVAALSRFERLLDRFDPVMDGPGATELLGDFIDGELGLIGDEQHRLGSKTRGACFGGLFLRELSQRNTQDALGVY